MELGLTGRVAIVGGASDGLGKACAMAFAREGAKVAICARRESELQAVAGQIRAASGAEVLAIAADLTKYDDIKRLVASTAEHFGRVDVLVNNTGGPPPGGFFDHSDKDWQEAFERLLMYPVRMCREAIPHMRKNRWGRIVNNTSIAVKEPLDNLILSNTLRTAVVALSKTMSRDLAKDNILINNVSPGYFLTKRMQQVITSKAVKKGVQFDAMLAETIKDIPIGRLQNPDELANLVVFLCSDAATSMTGTTILVDGGMARGLF